MSYVHLVSAIVATTLICFRNSHVEDNSKEFDQKKKIIVRRTLFRGDSLFCVLRLFLKS